MFKKSINSKYHVVSYDRDLIQRDIEQRIDEAEDDLANAEHELKKAMDEYDRLSNLDTTSESKLHELEKKIEDLEDERDDAEKAYESAKQCTVEDCIYEHKYQTWKGDR